VVADGGCCQFLFSSFMLSFAISAPSLYSLAVVVLLARGGVVVATASGSRLWFSFFFCF